MAVKSSSFQGILSCEPRRRIYHQWCRQPWHYGASRTWFLQQRCSASRYKNGRPAQRAGHTVIHLLPTCPTIATETLSMFSAPSCPIHCSTVPASGCAPVVTTPTRRTKTTEAGMGKNVLGSMSLQIPRRLECEIDRQHRAFAHRTFQRPNRATWRIGLSAGRCAA